MACDITYNSESSVFSYIGKQMSNNLDRKSIVFKDKTVDYRDVLVLLENASRVLTSLGFKKGDRVAIYVDKSDRFIILSLACLRLGICYIPIDKSYPDERVNYIIKDSLPKIVVVDSADNEGIKGISVPVETFFGEHGGIELESVPDTVSGEDSAYIIYTSGSTGKPKGIVVPHRSINNHMLWMIGQFNFDSNDVFFFKTPVTFDPSIWEYLLPFYIGACVVVFSSSNVSDVRSISKVVKKEGVSVLQLTPSIAHNLLANENPEHMRSLSFLFVGGESLSKETKKLFFSRELSCDLVNLYGPAEATIDTLHYKVSNSAYDVDHNIIGFPISNTRIYIVGRDNKLVSKEGEVGELYISGDCLSLGYVDENLTKKSFFKTAFSNGNICYRTGDLVKTVNGLVEYVGRNDSQIKLNGVRVNLDSIRDFITSKVSAICCEFDCMKVNQSKVLVCYIIVSDKQSIEIGYLLQEMRKFFPLYMIPSKIHVIDDYVTNPNGKVDLKRTKFLFLSRRKGISDLGGVATKLLEIWRSVLPGEPESIRDDFFDCGGSSITAYILSHRISKSFDLNFDTSIVGRFNTLEKQAKYIENSRKGIKPISNNIIKLNSGGSRKLFLIHPIGGTVFWYYPLARFLSGYLDIYGIADPEISSNGVVLNSVQEMASYYCDQILEIDHKGEYFIGGASYGATVAVEVAKILADKGYNVRSVISLDGWAYYPDGLNDCEYFERSMFLQQKNWSKEFNQKSDDTIDFERLFDIQKKRLSMLFSYEQSPYLGHIDLFKAKELLPVFQEIDEPCNHWRSYCSDVRVYDSAGDHESMFFDRNIKLWAKDLVEITRAMDCIET